MCIDGGYKVICSCIQERSAPTNIFFLHEPHQILTEKTVQNLDKTSFMTFVRGRRKAATVKIPPKLISLNSPVGRQSTEKRATKLLLRSTVGNPLHLEGRKRGVESKVLPLEKEQEYVFSKASKVEQGQHLRRPNDSDPGSLCLRMRLNQNIREHFPLLHSHHHAKKHLVIIVTGCCWRFVFSMGRKQLGGKKKALQNQSTPYN